MKARNLVLLLICAVALSAATAWAQQCYQAFPAGGERFVTSSAEVGLSNNPQCANPMNVSLTGSFTVRRSDPRRPDDGRCEIDTEIICMLLQSGPITVREQLFPRSLGKIKQQQAGVDFPADSFFDVFVEITGVPGITGTLFNKDAIRMQLVITEIPPRIGVYRPVGSPCIPLFRREDPEPRQPVLFLGHVGHDPTGGCVRITQPDAGYLSATNKCSLGVVGTDTTRCVDGGGNPEATFSPSLSVRQVPDSWATWSSPPFSESPTPMVGFDTGSSLNVQLGDFAARTAGLEMEPNAFDVFRMTATFVNAAGRDLITITDQIQGDSGARLFAARCSEPISSIRISVDDAAQGFGIAQVRADTFRPLGGAEPAVKPGYIPQRPEGATSNAGVVEARSKAKNK